MVEHLIAELRTTLEEARRPWRRLIGATAFLSMFFPGSASALSVGKYACIIEHAATVQGSGSKTYAGKLRTTTGRFIMNISENTERISSWCNNKELYGIHLILSCMSIIRVEIEGEDVGSSIYYGDARAMFSAILGTGFLKIFGEDVVNKPEFHLSESIPLDDGGWGQYLYRGQCDRF
jgi:hypothetical protein